MSELQDISFGRHYTLELMEELPSSKVLSHYYYPGGSLTGGHDGVTLRITPHHGAPWLGTFAFGRHGTNAITKFLGMPDPEQFCAVSRGAGYIVRAIAPWEWKGVRAAPIIDVRSVTTAGLVVFAELTALVAYDSEGERWRTQRLTWDNMHITEVTSDKIIGEYWDIQTEDIQTFEVDIRTGQHRGGIVI